MAKLFFIIFSIITISNGYSFSRNNVFVDYSVGVDTNIGTKSSPLKNISEAIKRFRLNKDSEDFCIYLRGGVHQLDEPIKIDSELLRGRRLVLKAYRNEKPVLSGGYNITGWNLYDEKKNIYYARLPKGIYSRQLFVDGIRARRAYENDVPKRWIVSDSIGHVTSDKSLLNLKNVERIECVYREIWTSPRCLVSDICQIGDTLIRIKMQQPGWKNCRNKGITSVRTPWYWENAFEFLDESGEWYIDIEGAHGKGQNVIFYKPYPWNNMNKSTFVLPVLESLVEIYGSVDNKVENLLFEGIGFSYTTWLRPSTAKGNPDAQNNVMRQNGTGEGESAAEKAAVIMMYTSNVVFDKCTFYGLGANGINMFAGCSNNTVSKSIFYDLSATAIQLGDYRQWDSVYSNDSYDPIDDRNLLSNNVIEHNHIERCGIEYRSATGIAAVFPVSTEFRNNTLKDLPYSGFHIGWGWTLKPYTSTGNVRIYRNKIQNVMMELADGGAIYTLGSSKANTPNIISENYINRSMWGQGIYLDNGSSYYEVLNNVYEGVDDYNLKINSGSHNCVAYGIYSNKQKTIIANNCKDCSSDSTQIISSKNKKIVNRLKENSGAKIKFTSIWEMIDDCNIYEFEYASLDGGVFSTSGIGTGVYDYSGMGFLSGFNRNKSNSVNLNIKISSSGKYNLTIRYSMGKGWIDNVGLKVNSSKHNLDLEGTSKGEWNTITFPVELRKGLNNISLYTKETSNDFLYLDVLYVDKLN